jgi:hypothetical protein
VEGRELYAVPVNFADVEVLPHFWDTGSGDVVCSAPDALGGFVLLDSQARTVMSQTMRGSRGLLVCPSVRGR